MVSRIHDDQTTTYDDLATTCDDLATTLATTSTTLATTCDGSYDDDSIHVSTLCQESNDEYQHSASYGDSEDSVRRASPPWRSSSGPDSWAAT